MRFPRSLLIVLALCSAAPGPSDKGGTVTGHVLLLRDRKAVKAEDVYVYLEELHPRFRKGLPGDGMKAEIRQEDTKFRPRVIVVPAGTEVMFPNYDNKEHNVFSPSDPPFDLGRYSKNPKGKGKVLKDAGEMAIFCDIHPEMFATVKVVESSWIAAVAADGTYTIPNVPPGKYKVTAWVHDSEEVKSKQIIVTDGDTITTEELHLQAGEWKLWHLRRDGTSYPCPPGYPKC
jgi:plastocyanin